MSFASRRSGNSIRLNPKYLRKRAVCSVSVANAMRVDVDCASPTTPFQLNTAPAQSLQLSRPDAGRVTVYF